MRIGHEDGEDGEDRTRIGEDGTRERFLVRIEVEDGRCSARQVSWRMRDKRRELDGRTITGNTWPAGFEWLDGRAAIHHHHHGRTVSTGIP